VANSSQLVQRHGGGRPRRDVRIYLGLPLIRGEKMQPFPEISRSSSS